MVYFGATVGLALNAARRRERVYVELQAVMVFVDSAPFSVFP